MVPPPETETEKLRRVLRQIWREYKQYLKRSQATPKFIGERAVLVEDALKEGK